MAILLHQMRVLCDSRVALKYTSRTTLYAWTLFSLCAYFLIIILGPEGPDAEAEYSSEEEEDEGGEDSGLTAAEAAHLKASGGQGNFFSDDVSTELGHVQEHVWGCTCGVVACGVLRACLSRGAVCLLWVPKTQPARPWVYTCITSGRGAGGVDPVGGPEGGSVSPHATGRRRQGLGGAPNLEQGLRVGRKAGGGAGKREREIV